MVLYVLNVGLVIIYVIQLCMYYIFCFVINVYMYTLYFDVKRSYFNI